MTLALVKIVRKTLRLKLVKKIKSLWSLRSTKMTKLPCQLLHLPSKSPGKESTLKVCIYSYTAWCNWHNDTATRLTRPDDEEPVPIIKTITYVLSIMSATEMKKRVSQRTAKSVSLQQTSDKVWDTFKAQILAKISTTLQLKTIEFADFSILFTIPRIIPKPGMPLTTSEEYAFMIEQAIKMKAIAPMINVHITENGKEGTNDKENEAMVDDEEQGGKKKKKKKVRTHFSFTCMLGSVSSLFKRQRQYTPSISRRTIIFKLLGKNGNARNPMPLVLVFSAT